MILVDTSVWVDHGRTPEPALSDGLRRREILIHEYVIGELCLGTMADRNAMMRFLEALPRARALPTKAVVELVVRERLFGTGIGFVDAHLVASALASRNAKLWTRDRRLATVVDNLRIRADPTVYR